MSMDVYNLGDTARLHADFEDADGVNTDPTTIRFRVIKPSGGTITLEYAGSPNVITKSATGQYYTDVVMDEVGEWFWQPEGTGPVQAVEPSQIMVMGAGF